MYREFYGFSEQPFSLTPDPRFLYPARSHFETLSSMISGIKERKGIIVVTGEVGLGKTILIHALLKDLSEKIKTAFIFNPALDFKGLLKSILRDLDVPFGGREEDLASLMTRFRKYLNERLSLGEIVAVVIDEAQNLEEEALLALSRFCSPDAPAGKVLQVLLVGHPELEMKLNAATLQSLNARVVVRCRLSSLTREEGEEYMEHRLRMAGRNISEVFFPGVPELIWEFARGVPRVINLVCDRALLYGYTKSRQVIDPRIVRDAMKDLQHLQAAGPKGDPRLLLLVKSHARALRILLVLLSVVIFLFSVSKILGLVFEKWGFDWKRWLL